MANFFWHSGTEPKMHWLVWWKLYQRREEGGLGFRRLWENNDALLAKQVWCLVTQPESLLHRILRQRYFRDSNLCAACMGNSVSLTWWSLTQVRDLVAAGIRCLIWRIRSPPKVLVFAWGCGRNVLPTLVNLGRRRLLVAVERWGCGTRVEETPMY
ncbi:hypothetical protein Salat_1885600 [Sesamum alatum]|uniref:Reverse transcriptase zinc-binding domain-containing protein n=1 Tax=Sesamum alatum TaxID=300844 RepID=A0AAE1Y3M4_9LAMI|nr:hypothetical protein Salat_1885600 [Sesamum alatum]